MGTSEKHYCIDAGIGEKMDGCPYSLFEDGHDVEEFIIPPKGFDFVGFRYEPLQDNAVYDGKLVAQYQHKSLKSRAEETLSSLVWVFLVIVVVGIIVLLAISVFKPKNNPNRTPIGQQTEIELYPSDSVAQNDSVAEVAKDTVASIQQEIENQTDNTIQTTQGPETADDQSTFVQDFWAFIHQREGMMDAYMDLYSNHKATENGKEFDYLRFTILKDYNSFKEWHSKLRKIPASELEGITTVDELKDKLNTIE